jgi:DNA-binding SARP family transcriptional activator
VVRRWRLTAWAMLWPLSNHTFALLSLRTILTEVYKLFKNGSRRLNVRPTQMQIHGATCATELPHLSCCTYCLS